MAAQITSVDPGSPAARAGVKAGERLRTINGHGIQDVLDYKFYSYDPRLTLTLEGEAGVRTVTLEKGEGEELGLNFETYLMDRRKAAATNASSVSSTSCPRACARRCILRMTTPASPSCWATTFH